MIESTETMNTSCEKITADEFSTYHLERLREIPQPPTSLWLQGSPPPSDHTLLSVVGSRSYTTYGKQVVSELIAGLRGYPIGIVSGLAKGIDGLAHRAAIDAGLYTLAIPGSGLDRTVLYPAQHKSLADDILRTGGGLLSELEPHTRAAKWTFPQRNRLMAGLAHATLLVEAGEKSGTLITARMVVDYNRDLLVVPGSIFSPNSLGVHQFLKLGATPITCSTDIVEALQLPVRDENFAQATQKEVLSENETKILTALKQPITVDALSTEIDLPFEVIQITLMQLEMQDLVRVTNGLYQAKI